MPRQSPVSAKFNIWKWAGLPNVERFPLCCVNNVNNTWRRGVSVRPTWVQLNTRVLYQLDEGWWSFPILINPIIKNLSTIRLTTVTSPEPQPARWRQQCCGSEKQKVRDAHTGRQTQSGWPRLRRPASGLYLSLKLRLNMAPELKKPTVSVTLAGRGLPWKLSPKRLTHRSHNTGSTRETYVRRRSRVKKKKKNLLTNKSPGKVKPTTNAVLNTLQSDK